MRQNKLNAEPMCMRMRQRRSCSIDVCSSITNAAKYAITMPNVTQSWKLLENMPRRASGASSPTYSGHTELPRPYQQTAIRRKEAKLQPKKSTQRRTTLKPTRKRPKSTASKNGTRPPPDEPKMPITPTMARGYCVKRSAHAHTHTRKIDPRCSMYDFAAKSVAQITAKH